MEKTEKKGFCMFFDWLETLEFLSPASYKALVKAIGAYYTEGKDMVESVQSSTLKALAHNIQQQIKRMEEVSANCKKGADAVNQKKKSDADAQREGSDAPLNAQRSPSGATNTDTNTNTDTETNIKSLSRPTAVDPASPAASEEIAAGAAAASPDFVGTSLTVRSSSGKSQQEKIPSSKLQQEFEELWNLYPRKEGKKKALAAYERARKRGVSMETVEDGVRRYAEISGHREMRYIKNGSTWFSGECWNDEVKEDGYRHDEFDESAQYAGLCGIEL